jgi:cytoskeletal protein CcmA (bactofilin family)
MSLALTQVENTIGIGTFVHGDLKGPGGFRIDGTVEGHVEADGPVIVGEKGIVEGNIRAREVVILGRVRGEVRSAGHLEIGPEGKLVGDVLVTSLRLHRGGVFRGASRMVSAHETSPFGILPAESEPRRRGRTLPPPDGAVPPPPIHTPIHSEIAPIAPMSHQRLQQVEADSIPPRAANANE